MAFECSRVTRRSTQEQTLLAAERGRQIFNHEPALFSLRIADQQTIVFLRRPYVVAALDLEVGAVARGASLFDPCQRACRLERVRNFSA
jgi:hypothetical protein